MEYQSIDDLSEPRRPIHRQRSEIMYLLVCIAEALLVLAVLPLLLVLCLYFHYGFAWDTKNGMMFNVHPLCMVLGFVILNSQGVIVYRLLPGTKIAVKLVHGTILFFAMALAIVGLVAVFTYHNEKGYPNLYSIHAWVGLMTFILFGLQVDRISLEKCCLLLSSV